MSVFYLGTQGFSHQDWAGNFYPPHTRAADQLRYYAEQFRAVEIDLALSGVPDTPTVQSGYDDTPPDFIFTVKFPRTITHQKKLIDAGPETRAFLKTMEGLHEKVGPLLLQLSHEIGPSFAPTLDRYLQQLPHTFRYVVEFRQKSWLKSEYLALLEKRHVAVCLHDLFFQPRLSPATADFVYIRWLGNRRQLTQFDRIQIDRRQEQAWWSDVIRRYLRQGSTVYGFVTNQWAGHAPSSAQQILELVTTRQEGETTR
jgi:uncharacterized protein YecE (DUF72 family)